MVLCRSKSLIQTISQIINSKGKKEEVIQVLQRDPQTCSKETTPTFLLLIRKLKGIDLMSLFHIEKNGAGHMKHHHNILGVLPPQKFQDISLRCYPIKMAASMINCMNIECYNVYENTLRNVFQNFLKFIYRKIYENILNYDI